MAFWCKMMGHGPWICGVMNNGKAGLRCLKCGFVREANPDPNQESA